MSIGAPHASTGTGTHVVLRGAAGVSEVREDFFDPHDARRHAVPVALGGRGGAWRVQLPQGEAVLRHYRRGGALARFNPERYLWRGADETRSVRELRITQALHARGLPVPRPIAAAAWRTSLTYRAAIVLGWIADARTLGARVAAGDAVPAQAIGTMLARFHAAGLDHVDLNVHNILLDAMDEPWLIDFDRCRLKADSRAPERNLRRLARSFAKLERAGEIRNSGAVLAAIGQAHAAALAGRHA